MWYSSIWHRYGSCTGSIYFDMSTPRLGYFHTDSTYVATNPLCSFIQSIICCRPSYAYSRKMSHFSSSHLCRLGLFLIRFCEPGEMVRFSTRSGVKTCSIFTNFVCGTVKCRTGQSGSSKGGNKAIARDLSTPFLFPTRVSAFSEMRSSPISL